MSLRCVQYFLFIWGLPFLVNHKNHDFVLVLKADIGACIHVYLVNMCILKKKRKEGQSMCTKTKRFFTYFWLNYVVGGCSNRYYIKGK